MLAYQNLVSNNLDYNNQSHFFKEKFSPIWYNNINENDLRCNISNKSSILQKRIALTENPRGTCRGWVTQPVRSDVQVTIVKKTIEGQTYTNSIGMQFVRIEPGTFHMGSKDAGLSDALTAGKAYLSDGDWDEQPGHQVTLTTPFYIGIFQVTNAQYEEFQPAHKELRGKLGFSQDDTEAVVFIDWHEATRFCEWLSEKEGLPYRLPTEAEWEYVCRAGDNNPFPHG